MSSANSVTFEPLRSRRDASDASSGFAAVGGGDEHRVQVRCQEEEEEGRESDN